MIDQIQQPFAVEMLGITKAFPGVVANRDVTFRARRGEVHALVGENGAGKSTLMSILGGLYSPDVGEIRLDGKPVRFSGPAEAASAGIGMVHQHFMLVPVFTVAENVILGQEPVGAGAAGRIGRIDRQKAEDDVRRLADQFGFKIDAKATVGSLSVGEQQRVEILKVLRRGARILILDEPTAVLTPQEDRELFAIMRRLAAEGKTVVFITHKLQEVMDVADSVTVLRQGESHGTVAKSETSTQDLARRMVGREVLLRVEKKSASPGDPVLTIEALHVDGPRGLPALDGFSLEVNAGEIVGLAGVEGNGQTELVEALAGLRPLRSGRITIDRHDVTAWTPAQRAGAGLALVPPDRHRWGLVKPMTVEENLVLGLHQSDELGGPLGWSLARRAERAADLIGKYDIRPPRRSATAASLSGGNQQKVVIARELSKKPRVLVAAQPTRGVDIGAIEFIHRRLIEERDAGKAVLLISSELEEIHALADRIAVIYEGRLTGLLTPDMATDERLGLLMAGVVTAPPSSAAGLRPRP